jgi:hypothetical protein
MTAYRRRPAVERQLMGERRLVQPVAAPAPTELGGSAPLIWDLLADEAELPRILELVGARFTDTPEVIEHGTMLAIRQLLDAGLIDEVDS